MSIPTGSNGSAGRPEQNNDDALIPAGRLLPFLAVTALFFLWAVPANLNDILIRQFMKSFNINRSSAAGVQLYFYLGYFLLAIPAGQLMRRFGYKSGIVTGLVLLGSGCWMFWPAAQAEKYGLFLAALFVIASGLSFLETAANPFIAQLGSQKSSARRLNFCQAFYPLGAIAAGLVGTVFIFSGVKLTAAQVTAMQAAGKYQAYLHAETLRVLMPYVVLGAVAFLWALLVVLTKFPALGTEDVSEEAGIKPAHVKLFQRHFVYAVIAQFLYVGAQVGTWSWFIQYVESATGVGDKAAGFMLTGTLAAFAVGRFSSAWLLHHIPARLMLGVYAAVNVVLGLVAVSRQNWLGVGCLLTTSLFMSMMFPTIFVLGIKGMGDQTKTAGSLLIMSIMGGALLPKLMGMIADARGLQTAYLVPVVCFAAIGLYAWLGAEQKGSELAS